MPGATFRHGRVFGAAVGDPPHKYYAEFEWADMDGKLNRRTVRHSKFGFGKDGKLHACVPVEQRVDLYAKS